MNNRKKEAAAAKEAEYDEGHPEAAGVRHVQGLLRWRPATNRQGGSSQLDVRAVAAAPRTDPIGRLLHPAQWRGRGVRRQRSSRLGGTGRGDRRIRALRRGKLRNATVTTTGKAEVIHIGARRFGPAAHRGTSPARSHGRDGGPPRSTRSRRRPELTPSHFETAHSGIESGSVLHRKGDEVGGPEHRRDAHVGHIPTDDLGIVENRRHDRPRRRLDLVGELDGLLGDRSRTPLSRTSAPVAHRTTSGRSLGEVGRRPANSLRSRVRPWLGQNYRRRRGPVPAPGGVVRQRRCVVGADDRIDVVVRHDVNDHL